MDKIKEFLKLRKEVIEAQERCSNMTDELLTSPDVDFYGIAKTFGDKHYAIVVEQEPNGDMLHCLHLRAPGNDSIRRNGSFELWDDWIRKNAFIFEGEFISREEFVEQYKKFWDLIREMTLPKKKEEIKEESNE